MTQTTLIALKEEEESAISTPTYTPDEPDYSPFKNFEEDRIRNACRASDATQRRYFETADMAHAICLWYWSSRFGNALILDLAGRSIDRAEAISLLKTFCRREPSVASLNLDRSRYASEKNCTPGSYGAEVVNSLGAICTVLDVVAE